MNALPQSLIDAVKPAPVERDEDGWFTHPIDKLLNPKLDEIDYRPIFEGMNLDFKGHAMEDELPMEHPAYVAYFDNGEGTCALWEPRPPEGDGWFLYSIHDSEDGPIAWWLRPHPNA